jgi:hypothetical protein
MHLDSVVIISFRSFASPVFDLASRRTHWGLTSCCWSWVRAVENLLLISPLWSNVQFLCFLSTYNLPKFEIPSLSLFANMPYNTCGMWRNWLLVSSSMDHHLGLLDLPCSVRWIPSSASITTLATGISDHSPTFGLFFCTSLHAYR